MPKSVLVDSYFRESNNNAIHHVLNPFLVVPLLVYTMQIPGPDHSSCYHCVLASALLVAAQIVADLRLLPQFVGLVYLPKESRQHHKMYRCYYHYYQ